MKKGLELFKTRVDFDFSILGKLECENVFLPPLYKTFFAYYEDGTFYSFYKFENLNNEEYNFITTIKSKNNTPIFDTLFDVNDIIKYYNNYCEGTNYIPIGSFGNEIMLVGMSKDTQDVIYKHRFNDRIESDPSFLKVANSIFELIFNYEEVESEILSTYNKVDIYRNWNEDFWRVREE